MGNIDGIEKFLIPQASTDEAAPGIERIDVEAVSARQTRELYAKRPAIYPRLASGTFRHLKWVVMAVTLSIYYLLPWIRWERGPNLPDQAFLLDFANQRLFFGPLEIWAQEFYFVIGLLVVSALGLFLVTSIAGRMWCGYTCPQTVWTDLMIAVERFWQGDRNARMRLDKEPWSARKVWLKAATHASWMLIGVATGGALVFYFRDAPTLAQELLDGTAPSVAYAFIGIFAGSTYLLGGIAREQVCIYMCPWPRIQGAMLDHDSLLIAYRDSRGEPRAPHKKGDSWDGRGDCIDCKACVAVCPMGIDIRDGAQLECIQCALCIDACDEIMAKVGRPTQLIAYSTIRNIEEPKAHPREGWRIVRMRTMLYAGIMTITGALMAWAISNRSTLEVTVLPDRNPLYVMLSDGGVSNGYTVKILNKLHDVRQFELKAEGLPEAKVVVTGFEDRTPVIEVVPDNLRALRVHLKVPRNVARGLASSATPIRFVIMDTTDGAETHRDTTFRSPQK
ncbi:MAG: cytochrome c oxidase accessory protein CcoG [Hyphomicrobium sp.]|jgi:cytochrome c oxidase accessory protein FixG